MFLVVEGVDYILIHDLSGLEEDNMMYGLDFVVSRAVLMSRYHFLPQVGFFPGWSIGCIQMMIYIWVVVVQLLLAVVFLVLRVGGWIW